MVTEHVITELPFSVPKGTTTTPPTPQPPVIPPVTPPVQLPSLSAVVVWWNSLSTLQKILLVVGVSGSVVTVVAIARREK